MASFTRTILLATLAGVAAVCLVAVLHAEPEPTKTEPPAATPPAPEPTVLAGPKVADKTEKLTLVQRDSEGKLVRVEDRPEIAAIPFLKLSGDAKKAADKVLNEHGTMVARVLNENQGLFLQIQNARQAGDLRGSIPLMRELRQKAPELWEPALIDKLARALPVEKAAQLRSIVGEYFVAVADEPGPDGRNPRRQPQQPKKPEGGGGGGGEGGGMMMQGDGEGGMMQGAGKDDMPPDAAIDPQLRNRIESNLIIREMARSFKTLVDMRREQVDHLMAGLGLTPEQDSKIRAMIHDSGTKAKGNPTQEDRRALIEEIKKLLTVEQQKQLQENMRSR
jgi:hypothetical protein